MKRTAAKIVFYATVVVLISWSMFLSYSFLTMVLVDAHWLVPIAGLVVFDVGMLAWAFTFLHGAQGIAQRTIALGLSVLDFIGVALLVMAEILLGGQTLADAPAFLGEFAVYGIAIWTAVNVGAVLAFHLSSPDARLAMAIQTEKDAVMDEAFRQLKEKRTAISSQLADVVSGDMLGDLVESLHAGDAPEAASKPAKPKTQRQPTQAMQMAQNGQPSPEAHPKE